jgi:hypothetical protein
LTGRNDKSTPFQLSLKTKTMTVKPSFGRQKHDLTGKNILQFFTKARTLQPSRNPYSILQHTGTFLLVSLVLVLVCFKPFGGMLDFSDIRIAGYVPAFGNSLSIFNVLTIESIMTVIALLSVQDFVLTAKRPTIAQMTRSGKAEQLLVHFDLKLDAENQEYRKPLP